MNVRHDINDMVMLSAWAYDMDELHLLEDVFTNDAQMVSGRGSFSGFATIVEALDRSRAVYRSEDLSPWHVVSNVHIYRESEEHVAARSYYTFLTKPIEPREAAPTIRHIGYYDDHFVYRGGVWRATYRQVCLGGISLE